MRTRSRLAPLWTIRWSALASAVGLFTLSGCAEQSAMNPDGQNARNFLSSASPPPTELALMQKTAAPQSPPGTEAGAAPAKKSATAGRKIIYDASVVLVTEDLGKFEANLHRIVETQGAFVADSDRTGATGLTREGHWKIRVPVEAYDALVRGVLGLGELVSTKAQSQDVSAEYYDLDARTAAKKVAEARLLKHLTDSTGKLEDILAVERELSRVRIEIEQMQGRLAVLGNLTTLATVNVTASEIKGYVPPEAPTLGMKVARTFSGSLTSLRAFGEVVLLAAVALTPWLPLLIPAGILAWLVARRLNVLLIAATSPLGARPRV